MPNVKSAAKRMRQNVRRRQANREQRSAMRTLDKKLQKSIKEGQLEQAREQLPAAVSAIQRGAKKRLIHKNTAARRASRLSRALNRLEQTKSSS
jgi:small subunit ribosomal protein S20